MARGGVIDERIVLEGRLLRLHFRTRGPCFAADLRDATDRVVRTSPALLMGGEYSGLFDLCDLPEGVYSFALRSQDEPVPFGDLVAKRHAKLASGPRATAASAAKFVGSSFPSDQGTVHAWLYADGPAGLRLRLSRSDDIGAYLDALAERDLRARPEAIRFSVVSPVYNVEKYLGDFFLSLVNQTIDFRSRIELIMVDDGSTDRSARVIKRWQRKYPDNIRYVRKENGGPASARNFGLEYTSREWVTFIDPDDFVDRKYFEHVDRAARKYGDTRAAMISCNLIVYFDATSATSDTHPLRFRFADGEKALPANDLGRCIQLNCNSVFFRKSLILAAGLGFDSRVRPAFEDGHFIARYLLACADAPVVFLPQAKYFYRKRADQSSVMDGAKTDPEWYGDQLLYGYLGLLRDTRGPDGVVPRQVQHTILYALTWRLRRVVDRPEAVAFLSEEQRGRFRELISEIFSLIEVGTIMEYDITELPFSHRVGILNLFKNADVPEQVVEITDRDDRQGLVRIVFWSRDPGARASFRLDGAETPPAYTKIRRRDFMGSAFAWEHIAWLPVGGAGGLTARVAGRRAAFVVNGRTLHGGVAVASVGSALAIAAPDERRLPAPARRLRQLARGRRAAAAFRDAWVFMDRDDQADDNAEHLYRHVRQRRPDINAFFVVRRDSADWARLAGEGFRLLDFNAPEHAVALLNATWLISSQADAYVAGDLGDANFGDMRKCRFAFLRHGVLMHDLSGWLNDRPIDCLVTSTRAEFEAIVKDGSPYRFSRKEVVLTGLPRHDALPGRQGAHRTIVVMPTWRSSLAGAVKGPGHERSVNRRFRDSEFAARWKSLLHSARLAALAEGAGQRVVFVAHPQIEPYLGFFDVPPAIAVHRFGRGQSIQDVFREGSLLITDFSSAAFDMAYLRRPVVYYQFDREFVFGGGHTTRPGYFDYRADGFGPVCNDENELLDAIEPLLNGTPPAAVYRERAETTFAFRDGGCCERVLEAILALDLPCAAPLESTARTKAAAG